MMENKNIKVTTAVSRNFTTKRYSQTHETTQGFMQALPIFSREYLPNRKLTINSKSLIRSTPLPVPTFGRAAVHNRAFFVPFRTVWSSWNDFITQTIHVDGNDNRQVLPNTPTIANSEFINLFMSRTYTTVVASPSSNPVNYDFIVYDSTNQQSASTAYAFTLAGIRLFKIIEALGYKINWNRADTFLHPALPLLCYAKVMFDWYYPSAYLYSSEYLDLKRYFELDDNTANGYDVSALSKIVKSFDWCTYEPDYFVNAWDTPNGPNSASAEGSFSINDIGNNYPFAASTGSATSVASQAVVNNANNNGTPSILAQSATGTQLELPYRLNQYLLDALKSLTDYTKRHQLVGVRALDRYLAEYGISLSNEILKRSSYLGSDDFYFDFLEVVATSDTMSQSGFAVGQSGARGIGTNRGYQDADFTEFGYVFVVNSIVPEISYVQGQHREMMHKSALDFYHGDYDHLGVQAVSKRELLVPFDGGLNMSGNAINTQVFGFVPRYIEYHTPKSLQTGLYRINSRKGLLPAFSLFRDLSGYQTGTLAAFKHDNKFVLGSDSDQYNRIFYASQSGDNEDNFNCFFRFDVEQSDSTLPPYETYEFEHADKNQDVIVGVNGSKMN